MKKILLIIPVLFLLAAGCQKNSDSGTNAVESTSATQTNAQTNAQSNTQSTSKVDTLINGLDQSVSSEEQSSTQSDADIVNSGSTDIINSSGEVSNASQN